MYFDLLFNAGDGDGDGDRRWPNGFPSLSLHVVKPKMSKHGTALICGPFKSISELDSTILRLISELNEVRSLAKKLTAKYYDIPVIRLVKPDS